MSSFFARLRNIFADRRGAARANSRHPVEMIVGLSADAGSATLFSHTLDVSRDGLSVFVPRVEASPLLTGGAAPLTVTLTLPQGAVSMCAVLRHVSPLKEGPLQRGFAAGFQIMEMAAADRAIYHSFVAALSDRA